MVFQLKEGHLGQVANGFLCRGFLKLEKQQNGAMSMSFNEERIQCSWDVACPWKRKWQELGLESTEEY